jgi:hypothetical protein
VCADVLLIHRLRKYSDDIQTGLIDVAGPLIAFALTIVTPAEEC